MLHVLTWNLSILAIAAIYYGWREGYAKQLKQKVTKNERVAQLLWAAANASK